MNNNNKQVYVVLLRSTGERVQCPPHGPPIAPAADIVGHGEVAPSLLGVCALRSLVPGGLLPGRGLARFVYIFPILLTPLFSFIVLVDADVVLINAKACRYRVCAARNTCCALRCASSRMLHIADDGRSDALAF